MTSVSHFLSVFTVLAIAAVTSSHGTTDGSNFQRLRNIEEDIRKLCFQTSENETQTLCTQSPGNSWQFQDFTFLNLDVKPTNVGEVKVDGKVLKLHQKGQDLNLMTFLKSEEQVNGSAALFTYRVLLPFVDSSLEVATSFTKTEELVQQMSDDDASEHHKEEDSPNYCYYQSGGRKEQEKCPDDQKERQTKDRQQETQVIGCGVRRNGQIIANYSLQSVDFGSNGLELTELGSHDLIEESVKELTVKYALKHRKVQTVMTHQMKSDMVNFKSSMSTFGTPDNSKLIYIDQLVQIRDYPHFSHHLTQMFSLSEKSGHEFVSLTGETVRIFVNGSWLIPITESYDKTFTIVTDKNILQVSVHFHDSECFKVTLSLPMKALLYSLEATVKGENLTVEVTEHELFLRHPPRFLLSVTSTTGGGEQTLHWRRQEPSNEMFEELLEEVNENFQLWIQSFFSLIHEDYSKMFGEMRAVDYQEVILQALGSLIQKEKIENFFGEAKTGEIHYNLDTIWTEFWRETSLLNFISNIINGRI